jgi:hypothetical protein
MHRGPEPDDLRAQSTPPTATNSGHLFGGMERAILAVEIVPYLRIVA